MPKKNRAVLIGILWAYLLLMIIALYQQWITDDAVLILWLGFFLSISGLLLSDKNEETCKQAKVKQTNL
jgi:predicted tellurium resistance membrane protein TerC